MAHRTARPSNPGRRPSSTHEKGGLIKPSTCPINRDRYRVYIRGSRYYGDFRDFDDVGGRQEALIPSGETRATTDADEATQLVAARLKELKEFRKGGHYPERVSEPSLEEYATLPSPRQG